MKQATRNFLSITAALTAIVVLSTLQGCTFNVTVNNGSTFADGSFNADTASQTANQYNEEADILPILAELYE